MMKGQKGITLIALVITIIVMLILVGVSVTIALNGGLFDTAKNARERTKEEMSAENNISNGQVTIKGSDGTSKPYNNINEFVDEPAS